MLPTAVAAPVTLRLPAVVVVVELALTPPLLDLDSIDDLPYHSTTEITLSPAGNTISYIPTQPTPPMYINLLLTQRYLTLPHCSTTACLIPLLFNRHIA